MQNRRTSRHKRCENGPAELMRRDRHFQRRPVLTRRRQASRSLSRGIQCAYVRGELLDR